jgi:hypothetical protein
MLPRGTRFRFFLVVSVSSSSALKTALISSFFRLLNTKLGPCDPVIQKEKQLVIC